MLTLIIFVLMKDFLKGLLPYIIGIGLGIWGTLTISNPSKLQRNIDTLEGEKNVLKAQLIKHTDSIALYRKQTDSLSNVFTQREIYWSSRAKEFTKTKNDKVNYVMSLNDSLSLVLFTGFLDTERREVGQ